MNLYFLMQDTGFIYGAERATLDLIRALKPDKSVRTHVLLIKENRLNNAPSNLCKELVVQGVSYDSIPVDGACSLSLIRAVRDRLVSCPDSVLHTVGYKADVHGVWASRAGRLFPVVSTVHGWLFRPDIKEQFYGWLNLQALKRADRIVALSSYYESYLIKRGIPAQRLCRIPSGLRPEEFSPDTNAMSLPTEPMIVGMMGRFSSEKNHAMLIRAAKRLKESSVPVRFVVAGTGPDWTSVQQLAEQQGVAHMFSWPGYMDTRTFFRDIEIMVMCSRVENLPYTILEGMACGRPVIATRVGGIPDLVQDGETGFLIPPDDDAALADKLAVCVRDRALVAHLGTGGRARLVKEFSMDRCLSLHLDMYASVLAGRAS